MGRYWVVMVDDFNTLSPPKRKFDFLENAQAYAKGLNEEVEKLGLEEYGVWVVEDTLLEKKDQ